MSSLNAQQHAAVTAPDGPALVLAGAGSGKTRVIVERLAWLAEERGVDPRQLLALTFTNKAASEMKHRLARRLDMDPVPAWMGTFHSFGLFVLRREMERLGRPKSFTIFDDSRPALADEAAGAATAGATAKVSPREALGYISRLKQEAARPTWRVDAETRRRRSTASCGHPTTTR
jgi:DNA helicase-2/ATP-dependent DNA helicase PcrA